MQLFKLLLVLGVLGFGANHLLNGNRSSNLTGSKLASNSTVGFVPVVMPDGTNFNEVIVLGPNCNGENGRRARALTAQLAHAQIPHRHLTSISINNPSDIAGVQRLSQVMQQGTPVVLIRGQGKANPSVEEVIAMYRGESKR